MKIEEREIPSHWNYFLSLEDDIAKLSRWIEFSKKNFECYSIELARLLMVASSEVDVVAKLLCKLVNKSAQAQSIHKYRNVLVEKYNNLPNTRVEIPRYGLSLKPWVDWNKEDSSPFWWAANNKVKHQRSDYFAMANLQNTLNAVAGLFILLILYYGNKMRSLSPSPNLFRPRDFAYLDGNYIVFSQD